MTRTMRTRPHDWHVHFSFYRKGLGPEVQGWEHRCLSQAFRGSHGMVKHHRDWMRHYAKMEAKQ